MGYKKQLIIDAFGSRFGSMMLHYAMEGVPLGTGGAIKNALRLVQSRDVVVLNGGHILRNRLPADVGIVF